MLQQCFLEINWFFKRIVSLTIGVNSSRELIVFAMDELGKFYKEYDGAACKAVIFSDKCGKAITFLCFKKE